MSTSGVWPRALSTSSAASQASAEPSILVPSLHFIVLESSTVFNAAAGVSSECCAVLMHLLFVFIIQDTEMNPDLE